MRTFFRPGSRSGFTFLEALIALAVAALLVTVSARSLTMVFRADRSAARLLEAGLLLRRVATSQYLGVDMKALEGAPPGWRVEYENVTTGTGDSQAKWTVARCSSEELTSAIAFRAP